jgi:hypothetical protein
MANGAPLPAHPAERSAHALSVLALAFKNVGERLRQQREARRA